MVDFSTWPLAELVEEVDIASTVTPDQENAIEELEAEIAKRLGVAARLRPSFLQ